MTPTTPYQRLAAFMHESDSPQEVREDLIEYGYDVAKLQASGMGHIRRIRAQARLARAEERRQWFLALAQRVRDGLHGRDVADAFRERFGSVAEIGELGVAFRRLRDTQETDADEILKDLYLLEVLSAEDGPRDSESSPTG